MSDPPDPSEHDLEYRPATHDDFEAVAAFTTDTWANRGASDYIPDVYHDWIDTPDALTLLADADGEIAGIAQCVLLSDHEAWCQGMRVHPEYRRIGISRAITHRLFDWASEEGAVVARNMVFSWNVPALGAARTTGFRPATEFRWMHPEPDGDADPNTVGDTVEDDLEVRNDPDAAWRAWTDSDARQHLRGLGLDRGESWALRELTRDTLHGAGRETAVLAVTGPGGVRAMTYRTRDYERETDDGDPERWAEYGAAAWTDVAAASALVAGIARDAASLGADRTRVLIPETVRHVTDASVTGAALAEEPDFVLAADLTGDYRP